MMAGAAGDLARREPRAVIAADARERVRVEAHAGARIVVVDLTGMPAEALPDVLDRAIARIREEPHESVLLATVVKDVRLATGVGELARSYSAAIRPHVRAGAVVGLSVFSKAIFLMVKPFLHASTTAFADLGAAKDWLVTRR